ncbi:hypothetical protein [Candidatus Protochlamydia phocaeensis]|uniref:hypothetical protein n=1 Tax=Candidatus Protochlamydia phocaeensis TaxID=1414722 RepID=UPI00083837D3|nr:hypothetical protein [Candidatus Protochlamydia phocaeensis]
MSAVTTSYNTDSLLIWMDRFCDRVPGASTLTNFINIFEKCVLKVAFQPNFIKANRYFSYINDKSMLRCIVLLVPVLGNIVIGLSDWIQKQQAENEERVSQNAQARLLELNPDYLPHGLAERRIVIENRRQEKMRELMQRQRAESEEREAQNNQARQFGLNPDHLPYDLSERRTIIENKRQEKRRLVTQEFIRIVDRRIGEMRRSIEEFEKMTGPGNASDQKKIEESWSSCKLTYAFSNYRQIFLNLMRFNQSEILIQKQQELNELKKQLLEIRRLSYRNYIRTLDGKELLKQAQKYYLNSFSEEDREGIQGTVEQIDLAAILPRLKERCLNSAKADYDLVEMQEISVHIEKNFVMVSPRCKGENHSLMISKSPSLHLIKV